MKTMFVNLTPHDIKIVVGEDEHLIPKSGEVARVQSLEKPIIDEGKELKLNGVPVYHRAFGDVSGLPERTRETENTVYLVSSLVLSASKRLDIAAPDTGPTAIRDEKGQIVAVTRLIMNP